MIPIYILLGLLTVTVTLLWMFMLSMKSAQEVLSEDLDGVARISKKRRDELQEYLLSDIKENRGDLNILADHLGVRFDTVPPQKSKRILRDKEDDSLVSEGVNNLEGI